ncbi:acyl-CoA thioesterase [Paracrocinitomix mangrovi]|uniref:acyl-CoA thioesterase n=1 Tax=Paracrocinitomix mangrovi TaxID=2862509 RepID=UPI001C8DB78C|nr:acyl-CoA thioesterase [Paracrocinitomix mangrovi]UKN02813.1 acyl-CoA thioesterase [Paracrocinitomix mangrovi]
MEKLALKLCMGKDIGVHGNLFGGIMLSWLDETAATWACSLCRNPNMVTVKIDETNFEKPVKIGNQVNIYGEVKSVGNSSMTIYVEARSYNFYTGQEQIVCSTIFIFVRIDEHGNAIPIDSDVREQYAHLSKD